MFNTTDCDLRYAAHAERVARIDRAGWQQPAAAEGRPLLAGVGALIARVGRLGSPTRRAGRVAAVQAGRGLS